MKWQDTYAQLFAEADAAKEQAKADFLRRLGNPARVPESQLIPLVDAITQAQWQALLRHIGPVSSDGSVSIGYLRDNSGVLQLDLRASSAWGSVSIDPSAVGYAKPVKTIVWQVSGATVVALWAKVGTADTAWSQIWPGTASAAYFHTLVDIDYTAMATTSLSDGDNAIVVPGSATGTVIHNVKHVSAAIGCHIQNGTGLGITGGTGLKGYFYNDASCQVSIPIDQFIAEVDHNDVVEEIWLWFYCTGYSENYPGGGFTSPSSGEEGAVVAFSTWPKDSRFQRCGITHNQYGLSSGFIGGANQSHKVAHLQSEDGVTVTPSGTAPTNNDLVIVFRIVNNFHVQMFTGPWNGGWPTRDQLKVRSSAVLGQQVGSSSIQTLWRSGLCDNYGAAAVMSVEGISTSYTSTGIFKRMRVEAAYASKAVPVLLGSGSGGGSVDEPFFDVTLSSGVLTGFNAHRNLRVSGTGPLVGVDTTGLGGGELLHLTFVAATTVTGNGSSSGAPIHTTKTDGTNWDDIGVAAECNMDLKYHDDGGFFKVVGGVFK